MEKIKNVPFRPEAAKNLLNKAVSLREILFWLCAVACLAPMVSAPIALLIGIIVANLLGNPYKWSQKATDYLLQGAVVGLGFGIRADEALKSGKEGFLLTAITIGCTILLGWLLGKRLKMARKTAFLVSIGTAICGGSAIAAVAPAVKAPQQQISMALGTIFILNSLALFIFPLIGRSLEMSDVQFGTWCAIAIHDTSSVVGAASQYSAAALKTAVTVKLARALWIIPVAFISAVAFGQGKGKGKGKIKIPYFIGLFILAICLNSFVPRMGKFTPYLAQIAQAVMTLALFFIGSNLSRQWLFAGGVKTLLQGSLLWIIIAGSTLLVIAG